VGSISGRLYFSCFAVVFPFFSCLALGLILFRECISKFGHDLGKQVWESINQAFDCMPLAATVDDKVTNHFEISFHFFTIIIITYIINIYFI